MNKVIQKQKLILSTSTIVSFCVSLTELVTHQAFANPITTKVETFNQDLSSQLSCPTFTPPTNILVSDETLSNPSLAKSGCANDLMGLKSAVEFAQTASEKPITPDENSVPIFTETQPIEENNRWSFKFQPYATIPLNTYGSATVKGRKVNYHLSLAEVLEDLNFTASGRFEAWKGRWGFIVDGYYVDLQGIVNFEKSAQRIPNTISALNYLLNKDVNSTVQELTDSLSQDVEKLEKVEELRQSPEVQTLKNNVQTFQETIAKDTQTLRTLEQDLQEFQLKISEEKSSLQAFNFQLQTTDELSLNQEELKEVIALNNQDLKGLPSEKIQTAIARLENLPSLQEKLTETRNLLDLTSAKISELRTIQDSEELQTLEEDVKNAKVIIDQKIQALDQLQDFSENRLPQELNANSKTDLQFDQGIYDFALSYHIGSLPMTELPKEPSNRPYPLVWFEPIAGVRLNVLNLKIDQTLDFSLSSSLVDFQGTFQQTFQKGRTWLEPMLGAKLGIQVSDPLIFWARGDVSGFGLAGDTDLSWNFLFGMDWWVRKNISLQLAYHFYEINYQNGTGTNTFGFQQSLNGPYVAATFHF